MQSEQRAAYNLLMLQIIPDKNRFSFKHRFGFIYFYFLLSWLCFDKNLHPFCKCIIWRERVEKHKVIRKYMYTVYSVYTNNVSLLWQIHIPSPSEVTGAQWVPTTFASLHEITWKTFYLFCSNVNNSCNYMILSCFLLQNNVRISSKCENSFIQSFIFHACLFLSSGLQGSAGAYPSCHRSKALCTSHRLIAGPQRDHQPFTLTFTPTTV